jgi:hypothetical protein
LGECARSKTCRFFKEKMATMPTTAKLLTSKFCYGNPDDCARNVVFNAVGRDKVPLDLFPNDLDTAAKIIKKNQK